MAELANQPIRQAGCGCLDVRKSGRCGLLFPDFHIQRAPTADTASGVFQNRIDILLTSDPLIVLSRITIQERGLWSHSLDTASRPRACLVGLPRLCARRSTLRTSWFRGLAPGAKALRAHEASSWGLGDGIIAQEFASRAYFAFVRGGVLSHVRVPQARSF